MSWECALLYENKTTTQKSCSLFVLFGADYKSASSGKIMKNLDYIENVNIILPYNKVVYSVNVNKQELEKFIGKDFLTIKKTGIKNLLIPMYMTNKKELHF